MPEPTFSFIIPTRGRPKGLLRLCDSIRANTRRAEELEIVLVTDNDDEQACRFEYPGLNVHIVQGAPGRTMSELNMAGYRAASGRYLMLLNDDVVIETSAWDDRALEAFGRCPDGIVLVHVNETIFGETLCTFPFLSGAFCELAGGICPEGYLRYRIDDHIQHVFDLITLFGYRRRVFLPDVVFRHLNLSETAEGHAYVVNPEIHALDTGRFDELLPERKRVALAAVQMIERQSSLGGEGKNPQLLEMNASPDTLVPVPDSVFERNARLRDQLLQTIRAGASPYLRTRMDEALGITAAPTASADPAAPIHVVISHGEINDQHGTGPLVKRVFRGRAGIFSIRFREDWGIHDFGDWHVRLTYKPNTRSQSLRDVRRLLDGRNVKTVTCVPFTAGELLTALAMKELVGAKLCVWIMDDQNIAVNSISDVVMKECLQQCSLRLTTHPELRAAYQDKYGFATYILPAVVPAHLVRKQPTATAWDGRTKSAALLGSFWDQSWFDRLCSALEQCDCSTDWYGQNRSPGLKFPPDVLARARIRPFGIVAEDRLAAELNKYPFVIVPAGALDGQDSNAATASLSLPGRILFAAATSHTPILVVGSDRSCAARFVRHFGIGAVAPYEPQALSAAMEHLRDPHLQKEMRRNAAALGAMFSDDGIADWLSTSIEQGSPADDRFEKAFSGYNATDRGLTCETK